jgi:hypothetical protein
MINGIELKCWMLDEEEAEHNKLLGKNDKGTYYLTPVTFYSIDSVINDGSYIRFGNNEMRKCCMLSSGGVDYLVDCTYEEVNEKIKENNKKELIWQN